MQRFEYYGDLEKVVEGTGELYLKDGKKHHVNFEIVKRGEEILLFNVVSEVVDDLEAFSLLRLDEIDRIEGFDSDGIKNFLTGLLPKDSTIGTKTNLKNIYKWLFQQM